MVENEDTDLQGQPGCLHCCALRGVRGGPGCLQGAEGCRAVQPAHALA